MYESVGQRAQLIVCIGWGVMRIFIIFLCLCGFSVSVYGATVCKQFDPGVAVSGREWVDVGDSGQYKYYCGEHTGDDAGCPNGADVYAKGSSGYGIYTCYANAPDWSYNNPNRWIADCPDEPYESYRSHDTVRCGGSDYNYYADYVSGPSYGLKNICKIPKTYAERYNVNCESSGGSKLICDSGCYCNSYSGLENKTGYECRCADSDAHLDENYKVCVKGNFYACNTDADCLRGRTPVKPSHSKAWRCVNQKYDVKVCAATECDDGWHVKQGYGFCEQDAQESDTPPDEITSEAQSSDIQIIPRQECSEPEYMDVNCNCVVPGTWKQGNRCVCTDSNKEIRNGKCEYTAAYINKITSDIESIYNDIKSLTAGFGVSVWHDAEGKFNTARLASDSIAGVVLGTVGGVVTSRLVKKAQVKQGFEDIGCHIGGQSIANYGDEFMVGR